MKKLLVIIVLGLLWSGNANAARSYNEILTDITKKDLKKCVEAGKWICEPSKIKKIIIDADKYGVKIDQCIETDYKAPCRCDYETNVMKRKYCEFKTLPKSVKKSKMQAADYCSNLSNTKNPQVREEYFKICMKEEGY